MTETTLFERNLAAFARRFPTIEEAVRTLDPPNSRVTGSIESGDLNLDLGHTLFYEGGAVSYCQDQVDAFKRAPSRFYMEPPPRYDPPRQQQDLVTEALYHYGKDRPVAELPTTPAPEGGYLLVYGIGLGLHLPPLLTETPARHFVLIEEHFEFFYHSLSQIDWAETLELLDENGQTLQLIFGEDPTVVAARVHWYMRGNGFGLIDGSYLFRHYHSTLMDKVHEDFVEKLPLLPISIGFFEDELVMLDNCTTNLAQQSFSYLDVRPRLQKDIPAFIIGSGPSLDRTIELVKRYQGEAMIFSCGTALQPLLRAGIRPDFHCELENVIGSVDHIRHTAETYSLDGITLLASTTVHPEMGPLFGERIFYFRDSVSSTPLWCPDRMGIHGTAPTCTNLALRLALIMAFRDIYLFGVDLGTRDARAHHTQGSIYADNPQMLLEQEGDPLKVMNIEMPGNFGGKAYTNKILQWARMMMVQAIEVWSTAKIYNCSDGVSVPGTLPKLAQTLRFAAVPGRKQVTLGRLKREIERKGPGEMAPATRLAEVRSVFQVHYRDMIDEVARARAERIGFIAFYERLQPYLAIHGENRFQGVLRSVNIGTIMMCFQIGYFFYRRVPDTEQDAVMDVFLGALAERLADMAIHVDGTFERVQTLNTMSA